MVNDVSRRSHDLKDELGGKRNSWGVCERALKPHLSRKDLSGKARPKPDSGNPTFRDCRGARGNVTLPFDKVRAPRLYPDRNRFTGTGSKPPSAAVAKSYGRERGRKRPGNDQVR